MSTAPSPSSGRGETIVQPAYFTSSAFVRAARADIDGLVREYSRQYARSAPFALFKQVWQRQGWTWLQFKVFDARSRAAFLRVTMRLFLERIGAGGPPLSRAAALFGLYTMYVTQPSTPAPPLHSTARVEVTCDVYKEMLMLPDALDGEYLLPVRPHVIYVQASLLQAQVFHVLPHGEMHPLNPRALPREIVEDVEVATPSGEGRKKKGRPCRHERTQRARESLVALEGWGEGGSRPGRYLAVRSALLDAVGGDERWAGALARANAAVVARMQMLK